MIGAYISRCPMTLRFAMSTTAYLRCRYTARDSLAEDSQEEVCALRIDFFFLSCLHPPHNGRSGHLQGAFVERIRLHLPRSGNRLTY